mgnify:CR=1 FL=1
MKSLASSSSSVPMSKKSLEEEITRLIHTKSAPKDLYHNHSFCQPLFIAETLEQFDQFQIIVDKYFNESRGKAKKLDQYRKHVESILLNLSQSVVKRHWLLLSGDPKAFDNGRMLSFCGLTSFDHTQRFLRFLEDSELLQFKTGKLYENEPVQNRYWSSNTLATELAPFGLYAEAKFRPPYVRINSPDETYEDFTFTRDHPDIVELTEINEFAREQHWACKAPIVQVFKQNPFYSGRLHTPFQNLPTQEFNIRKQTLINGEEIIETDFNANHLRIFLVSKKESCNVGDPYMELAEMSGSSREEVKGFINVALNSSNYKQAEGAALGEWQVSPRSSQSIYRAFQKRYPKLNLLCGYGTHAMAHEGMIMRNVLLQGVKDGVLALPIHDAIATNTVNKDWARDTMLHCWSEWMKQIAVNPQTVVKQGT